MYKGPGTWISVEDLWFMKESFGFGKAPLSLELVARAAKLRVAAFGCYFSSNRVTLGHLWRLDHDNLLQRRSALNDAKVNSIYFDRVFVWADWYNKCYCEVLLDNAACLKGYEITMHRVLNDIGYHSSDEEEDEFQRYKKGFEKHT